MLRWLLVIMFVMVNEKYLGRTVMQRFIVIVVKLVGKQVLGRLSVLQTDW